MTDCLSAALHYARSGLAVFPAPRGTKMSYKSAAQNGGVRWGATKDPIEIRQDWTRWPHANVGVVCGVDSGIFVVETDCGKSHGDVNGEESLTGLIHQFHGVWPVTRTAISPSGSRHYYFMWPPKGYVVRNSTSKLAPGIDVRGEGGMVIAPPSWRPDGEYRWVSETDIVRAPYWLLTMLMQKPFKERDGYEAELVDSMILEETMKHVPVELNWHDRNTIGMAIFASTNGSDEGLEIWDKWLRRSGKYAVGASAKRWRQMHRSRPTNIGYGTLQWRAAQANPDWMEELDKMFLAMNDNG